VAPEASAAGPTKRDCVAANEAGQDLRRAGKLHDARSALATCAVASCPKAVRDDCVQRLAEDDAAIPTLVFVVRDGSGNDITSFTVFLDGIPVTRPLDGAAVEVDPGDHHVEFRAEGLAPIRKDLLVREGERDRRIEAVFARPPASSEPGAAETQTDRKAPNTGPRGETQRWSGVALGGAGAASLVVGGVLALVAKATYSNAVGSECKHTTTQCSLQGAADGGAAHAQAAAATAMFVAGGALLAAGAAVYFTVPGGGPAMAVGPSVDPRGAGFALRGSW
jgi:hypothetical protein